MVLYTKMLRKHNIKTSMHIYRLKQKRSNNISHSGLGSLNKIMSEPYEVLPELITGVISTKSRTAAKTRAPSDLEDSPPTSDPNLATAHALGDVNFAFRPAVRQYSDYKCHPLFS